jgi:hypothetical protein
MIHDLMRSRMALADGAYIPEQHCCSDRQRCHGTHHRLSCLHRHPPKAVEPLVLAFHRPLFATAAVSICRYPRTHTQGSTYGLLSNLRTFERKERVRNKTCSE